VSLGCRPREQADELELLLADSGSPAGPSVRTLQRTLAKAGLTFSKLMEETRKDTALRLLEDPGIKLIDVSLELGYSDPAHFTRAFRRWTGVPPNSFQAG